MWASNLLMILLAIIADYFIGDPRSFPHYTRIIGNLSSFFEHWFWLRSRWALMTGAIHYGIIVTIALSATWLLMHLGNIIIPFWGSRLIGFFIIFQSIAYGDLMLHLRHIIGPLEVSDLTEARNKLSMIVGRDTESLDETEIARAAIESLAESINDGVLGTLSWTLLLGPAGAILHRVTNTLDSMVGHRDQRYRYYGCISARMDDMMAWFSARWIALLIKCMYPRISIRAIFEDGRRHESVNAGFSESAYSHVLGVRLGGTNRYQGEVIEGIIMNPNGKLPTLGDLKSSVRLTQKIYILTVIFWTGLWALINGLIR